MAGGSAEAVQAARPIFETFANRIVHLGEVGTGQVAKLVNNSLMAANMGLAHSAIALGGELGLDRTALAGLLNASSGRSYGLEVYTRMSGSGTFTHGRSLFGKVELLAQVAGPDHPAIKALRSAAARLPDLASSHDDSGV